MADEICCAHIHFIALSPQSEAGLFKNSNKLLGVRWDHNLQRSVMLFNQFLKYSALEMRYFMVFDLYIQVIVVILIEICLQLDSSIKL